MGGKTFPKMDIKPFLRLNKEEYIFVYLDK